MHSCSQVASGAQRPRRLHVTSARSRIRSDSADGRSWEPALADGMGISTVAAGDDGFVAATLQRPIRAGRPLSVVASADGLEWFDAIAFGDGAFLTASRGGDWIATTTVFATQA